MPEKVIVRFLKQWNMYNATETAGFFAEQAARLVSSGIAQYTSPKAAPKPIKRKKPKEAKVEESTEIPTGPRPE